MQQNKSLNVNFFTHFKIIVRMFIKSLSDHSMIKVTIQVHLQPNKHKQREPRADYWNVDYERVNEYILNKNLNESISGHENFMTIIGDIRDKFVPLKTPRKPNLKPWITNAHKKLINKERKLWHKYRNTLNP